jgi:uncharacterized protein (TIGR03435 family)
MISDLRYRIRHSTFIQSRLSAFPLVLGVALLCCGDLGGIANAPAQTPAASRAAMEHGENGKSIDFDVVSIRPARASGWSTRFTEDSFEADSVPVQYLLRLAFSPFVAPPDILGAPKWTTETYDIRAKVAPEDIEAYRALSREQQGLLLQKLLVDRFHLRFHYGTTEHSAYNLTLFGSGSKLKALDAGKDYKGTGDNEPIMPAEGGLVFRAHPDSMAHLARRLSWTDDVERKVVLDRTRLTGFYNFDLTWCPIPEDPNPTPTTCDGASLFTALREQLGLELKPTKASFPTLIIDEIERPTPN